MNIYSFQRSTNISLKIISNISIQKKELPLIFISHFQKFPRSIKPQFSLTKASIYPSILKEREREKKKNSMENPLANIPTFEIGLILPLSSRSPSIKLFPLFFIFPPLRRSNTIYPRLIDLRRFTTCSLDHVRKKNPGESIARSTRVDHRRYTIPYYYTREPQPPPTRVSCTQGTRVPAAICLVPPATPRRVSAYPCVHTCYQPGGVEGGGRSNTLKPDRAW